MCIVIGYEIPYLNTYPFRRREIRSMQFSAGRPDLVRAINQRWLLKFWQRALAGQKVPLWRAVEAENLDRVKAGLSFLDIETDPARYRITFHGEFIAKVYGSTECCGLYLDEIVPAARYPHAQTAYAQLVHSACPVYTIQDVIDSTGRLVQYERLLLPFSSDGASVDRILGAFDFICADGGFDGHRLMITQTGAPVLRLSATLEARVMA
jgi:hypothetical protein